MKREACFPPGAHVQVRRPPRWTAAEIAAHLGIAAGRLGRLLSTRSDAPQPVMLSGHGHSRLLRHYDPREVIQWYRSLGGQP